MAQLEPKQSGEPGGSGGSAGLGGGGRGGRKALRYGVPVAVAGVAAATVGLVPALADTGDPDLPSVTAEELVSKMAESDAQSMSGTVKVNSDLGLPQLPGMGGGSGGGGPFGGSHGAGGEGGSSGTEGGEGGGEKGEGGASPQEKLAQLASGEHTLRVAADGPERQKLSIVEDTSEYSLIRNASDVWGYDSGSNSVWHGTAPEKPEQQKKLPGGADALKELTPQQAAELALESADDSTDVSVDGTAKVAGRDAYQLVAEPKGASDTTVGEVRIAVDAERGVPLKFTLTPEGGGQPVFDAAYTEVDFGKPSADTFDFTPPKGAEVTERKLDGHGTEKRGEKHEKGAPGKGAPQPSDVRTHGSGWDSVAQLKLPAGLLDGKGGVAKGGSGSQGGSDAQKLLDGVTEKVDGEFGEGRVFSTRLVNALITEDGTVYAGAVTKEGLVKAANSAE